MMLEIRHQISVDTATGKYHLRETFGKQAPMTFAFDTQAEAEAAAKQRMAFLKEMVASISPEARAAVEDARHIDNLRAGKA